MKDIILVTAYCPKIEQKEILIKLLQNLNTIRDKYDIMITSHTILDSYFLEYCDYFYFDKKNPVLNDIEYRNHAFFDLQNENIIWSNYTNIGNTHLTILRLIIPAINLIKSLNYKKIHFLEYDCKFYNSEELDENSELLNKFDCVIYENIIHKMMLGAFKSFNVNKMISLWENYDENKIKKIIEESYPKTPERVTFRHIEKELNFYKKETETNKLKGMEVSLIYSSNYNWNVPFYQEIDNRLKFISWNNSDDSQTIKIIINDDKIIKFTLSNKNHWRILDIGNYDEIENIIIIKNDEIINRFNFSIDYKEKFKKSNFITKKS
jgi:hypothetical protein